MIDPINVLVLGTFLAIKHFAADGPMQVEYKYAHKGKFGHPGGLWHAFDHGIGTFGLMLGFGGGEVAVILGLLDFVSHYLIDWIKVQVTSRFRWAERVYTLGQPQLIVTDNKFFIAIVADQSAHFLVYVVIVWLALSGVVS